MISVSDVQRTHGGVEFEVLSGCGFQGLCTWGGGVLRGPSPELVLDPGTLGQHHERKILAWARGGISLFHPSFYFVRALGGG